MTYLELVQRLHQELRLSGSQPAGVSGLSGQQADLATWISQAYTDIQLDNDGKWKWLRREFTLNTVSGTQRYAYTDCTDVDASAAIARFKEWDLHNEDDPPKIYLQSSGVSAETWIWPWWWLDFKRVYRFGTTVSGQPAHIAEDEQNRLWLGPEPNDVYVITGNYWRSPQTLENDGDEPEMPSYYHMAIVYEAMVSYAYNLSAGEALARAQTQGRDMRAKLDIDQSWARQSFGIAPGMA